MTRYRGRSSESNTLLFSNQFFSFSWGEALFLNVPHPYFLGRGDLWLRDPLAQSYGAKVKTFYAEK